MIGTEYKPQLNTALKLGEHYICELSYCDQALLLDSDRAIATFSHAVRHSGLTVIDESSYKFSPHGFSCIMLLAESHASLHAWPEYRYCAVDVFTCNLHLGLQPLFDRLGRLFGAQEVSTTLIDRHAFWETLNNGWTMDR